MFSLKVHCDTSVRRNSKGKNAINLFSILPTEMVKEIAQYAPYSCLSVDRKLFNVARSVIIETLLSIPEPKASDTGTCYTPMNFYKFARQTQTNHSYWCSAQLLGLSLCCTGKPLILEVEEFYDRLKGCIKNDDTFGLCFLFSWWKIPWRDHVLLFKVLTREDEVPASVAKCRELTETILYCDKVPLVFKKRLITQMHKMKGWFSLFGRYEHYRILPQDVLDIIIAIPNSELCFYLDSSFTNAHAYVIKELYKKGKITKKYLREVVDDKDTLIVYKLNYGRDSDDDYGYDHDIVDRYDNVVVSSSACEFESWVYSL